ncbi:hypothetical protein [Streptomyces sp. NPDC086010]
MKRATAAAAVPAAATLLGPSQATRPRPSPPPCPTTRRSRAPP